MLAYEETAELVEKLDLSKYCSMLNDVVQMFLSAHIFTLLHVSVFMVK